MPVSNKKLEFPVFREDKEDGRDEDSLKYLDNDAFSPRLCNLYYKYENWSWLAEKFIHENGGLPTWEQVEKAIKDEQRVQCEEKMAYQQDKLKRTLAIAVKLKIWDFIFAQLGAPDDTTARVTVADLERETALINKAVYKLYSMEVYLYGRMNWAAREKKASAETNWNMGCFAAVLTRSLQVAEQKRPDQIQRAITVHRGTTLYKHEVKDYQRMVGYEINFRGFASTSLKRDMAITFATKYVWADKVPVLFEITLVRGTGDGFSFQLNNEEFTAYPEEQEILLDDGRPLKVVGVSLTHVPVMKRDENGKDKLVNVAVHIVSLETRRKQELDPAAPGTLKAVYNFDNDTSQSLNSYYTRMRDGLSFCCLQDDDRDRVALGPAGKSHGYLATVSCEDRDADTVFFEPVDEAEQLQVAKGDEKVQPADNIYRLHIKKRKNDGEEVKRWLSVQPFHAQRAAGGLRSAASSYVVLQEDEKEASWWQFERKCLKNDSLKVDYIIKHHKWSWQAEGTVDAQSAEEDDADAEERLSKNLTKQNRFKDLWKYPGDPKDVTEGGFELCLTGA